MSTNAVSGEVESSADKDHPQAAASRRHRRGRRHHRRRVIRAKSEAHRWRMIALAAIALVAIEAALIVQMMVGGP